MAFKTHHNFWIHYMKMGQILELLPGSSGVHHQHSGWGLGWSLGSQLIVTAAWIVLKR